MEMNVLDIESVNCWVPNRNSLITAESMKEYAKISEMRNSAWFCCSVSIVSGIL